jgi:site-specific DNA-methyltransferase (adenine-specific)
MIPFNTVLTGDCRKFLRDLPDQVIDFVLTDPPYFVSYRDRSGRRIANDGNDVGILSAFNDVYRVLKQNAFCVSFYGWGRADEFLSAWRYAGFRVVGHLVWCKPYASKVGFLRARHEQAYLLIKGNPAVPREPLDDVREWDYSGNKLHPTEKAVSILEPLIQAFCPEGGCVLDPFCGSGSSLLAAARQGRRYLGMELDPGHVATIKSRLGLPAARPKAPAESQKETSLEAFARWLGGRGMTAVFDAQSDERVMDTESQHAGGPLRRSRKGSGGPDA